MSKQDFSEVKTCIGTYSIQYDRIQSCWPGAHRKYTSDEIRKMKMSRKWRKDKKRPSHHLPVPIMLTSACSSNWLSSYL